MPVGAKWPHAESPDDAGSPIFGPKAGACRSRADDCHVVQFPRQVAEGPVRNLVSARDGQAINRCRQPTNMSVTK